MSNTKKRLLSAATALGVGLTALAAGIASAAPDPGADNIDPTKEGSLTIHKYEGSPIEGAAADGSVITDIPNPPLEGVTFTLYKVEGLSVTEPSDWPKIDALDEWVSTKNTQGSWSVASGGKIGDAPADYQILMHSAQETNAQGEATWPTLPLGVYFAQETGAPNHVAEHVLPFLVMVPMPHNSGTEAAPVYDWLYDVNVYPKNAIIDVEKSVTDPGPAGVGSDVAFTITDNVASTQRPFEYYNLFDLLNDRYKYVEGSTVLKYGDTTLTWNTDYYLTVGPKTADSDRQSMRIDFTQDGLDKLGRGGQTLTWDYKVTVLRIGDGTIPNTATVYPNKPGSGWGIGSTPPPGRPLARRPRRPRHRLRPLRATKPLSLPPTGVA
mgnify:CR=1 FL=1